MAVLSYIGPLVIVSYIVANNDPFVKFHIKQGLVLADFAWGTAVSPEFSTTLFVELPGLEHGPALEWHGPGIQQVQRVGLQGLPADFWAQWQANHAAFPQGVDIVFTCGEHALGLSRTTRVRRLEGV